MLHNLKSPKLKAKRVQVGRGIGSGSGGHTAGRGQKGQKSRSGYKAPRKIFEGGSLPIIKRIPKLKGFTRATLKQRNPRRIINVEALSIFAANEEVSNKTLFEKGLIKEKSRTLEIKIVGNGKLDKALTIKGIKATKSAKEVIEKSGGKIVL